MSVAKDLANSRKLLVEDDVDLLHRIADNLPAEFPTVVDIGAGSGTTALAILERNEKAGVVSYDISEDAVHWAGENVRVNGFADRWHGVHKTSLDGAADQLAFGFKFDAVLLDTSHTYSDTIEELFAWVPLIKPGGWLWCHDYAGDGGVPENGVRQAVDEFMEDNTHLFCERYEQGLGIAFRRFA